MPNRRDVVKSAISISALPLMGGAFVSRADGFTGSGLRDVLVDERHAASRAFGRMAAARGLNVESSRGDWSRLWLTRLDREWRAEPAPIAGVSHHGPLFTFEQLARPRGMRPIFVAELRRYSNGAATLRASGPAAAVMRAEQSVGLDDETWGASMGEILGGISADSWRTPAGCSELTHGIAAPPSAGHPDPIYAWLIGPAARAPRFI
jgi:hypothetical protein